MSFIIPKQFIKGSLFAGFSAVLVGLSGYLSRRFMANHLSENDYAFFYSTMALLGLVVLVTHFGFSDVILYELPGMLAKKQHRRASCTYHYTNIFQQTLMVIFLVLLFSITPLLKRFYFDYPINNIYLWFFFLLLWGLTLENTTLFTLNSLKQFGMVSFLRTLKSVFFLLGICISIYTPYPLFGIILSMVAITTFCTWFGRRMISADKTLEYRTPIPRSIRNNVLKGGIIFLFLSGGYTLMQDFGTFVLSFCSTSNEVVLFNIALPISMIVLSFAVVVQVFTPMIADSYVKKEKKRLKQLFYGLLGFTAIAVIIGFFLFWWGGKLIIRFLFSEKFTDAHLCTLFLVEAAILSIPVRVFLMFFNVVGQRIISVKTLIPTIFSAFIAYPLLSICAGATGAGIATLVTTVVWLIGFLIFYIKFMSGWCCNE